MRWSRLVLCIAGGMTGMLAAGCRTKNTAPVPEPSPVVLDIRNDAVFDVAVHAVPYASSVTIRLATIGAFSARQIYVPRTAMRMNDVVVLRLHAIGSRYSWTSPELVVSPGLMGCLEIRSDYRGDLSRSSFYSVPRADTTAQLVTPKGLCGQQVTSGESAPTR
ncbi:MAG: hypothetical protein U0163_03040 [Gemmatimonadaceae bacterium]